MKQEINNDGSDNVRDVCTVYTTGRLGNILFQVAAAHVHCLADNYDLCIVDSQHTTDEYKDTFLRNVNKCISHDCVHHASTSDAGITSMSYRPIEAGDKQLFGYYQSHKHFENYGDAIRLLFSPSQEFVNAARFRYRGLLDADDFPHYYAVHIRRGDYAHEPDLNILTEEWYFEAMKRAVSMDERSKFMIFSDDIDWCKRCESFMQLSSRILMFEESDANSTLWFMSSFHNYIISNSTFSWWSVYLNQTAKTVIAPLEWFSATCRLETPDLFMDSWIRLPVPTVRSPRVADTIRSSDIITGERIQRLCDVSIGLERYYDLNDNIHMYCSTQNIIYEPGRYTQDRPLVLHSKNVFVYADCLERMLAERSVVFEDCRVYSYNSDRTWADLSHDSNGSQFADLQLLSDAIHVGTTFYVQNLCMSQANSKEQLSVPVKLLPIGIANTMYEYGDVDTLYEIMLLSSVTNKTQAVYFEFSIDTNPLVRLECHDHVTQNSNLIFRERASDYKSYLQTLSQHKYCICPEGNGANCHRTWECFYLGVTPIMRRTPFSETLAAFMSQDEHRIVLVDSWKDVNDEYVAQLVSMYAPSSVSYDKLKLRYTLMGTDANDMAFLSKSRLMFTDCDSLQYSASILTAVYKTKWHSSDVTVVIKSCQVDTCLRMHVVNNVMGVDPHPGYHKLLKIVYEGDCGRNVLYAPENEYVEIQLKPGATATSITTPAVKQSMHLILVHTGQVFPSYLNDCISQIRCVSSIPIIVLMEPKHVVAVARVSDLTVVPIDTIPTDRFTSEFLRTSRLDTKFRHGFFRAASLRFLHIYNYVKQHRLRNVFHIEYDNLIYQDFSHLLPLFQTREMMCVLDAPTRCIPSFVYWRDADALFRLILTLIKTAKQNENDMTALAAHAKRHPDRVGALPIITPDYGADALYSSGLADFRMLFDGAAVGQYIGGVDPRNCDGHTVGFINETTVFRCDRVQVEWRIGADELRRPFLNNYPMVNLHVHSKDLRRWMSYRPHERTKLFDIVIPVGPNDIGFVWSNIACNSKHIIGHRNIYIVTSCLSDLDDKTLSYAEQSGCTLIDEACFPFKKDDIAAIHGRNARNGWYLQQLLKLYSGFVITGILPTYLVLDADTVFLRSTTFLTDHGEYLFNVGTEYHAQYFSHMERVHTTLTKQVCHSGICHHMIFNTEYVRKMMDMVETNHNKTFWRVFLEEVTDISGSGASEYEMYFHYMMKYHPRAIQIRILNWENASVIPKEPELDYVSVHHYMRK